MKVFFYQQIVLALIVVFTLSGCAVGPDYVRPEMDIPPEYREPIAGWKYATPSDDQLSETWWTLYRDETLARLIKAIDVDNQSLKATEARYRQARALLASAQSGLFPTLDGGVSASRAQGSGNQSSLGNQYNFSLNASWNIDLWGRVRRDIEAQRANVELGKAELDALRLSLQTTLAQTYFQLRTTDARIKLMDEIVAAYQTSHEMTLNRYNAGIVTRSDVSQALTQLEGARTQRIDLDLARAQSEHALALLIGRTPSQFSLETDGSTLLLLPEIPVAVPSQILERRPDIASAERAVASANANIGIAQAAFYPSLILSASGGYRADHWSDWFDVPSRIWSLGASLAQYIFDGGQREAARQAVIASYDATVATYKQTVLTAFGEVENNLTALRVLDDEMYSQQATLRAARETETLTLNQYKAGTTTYLNVVIAQTARLNAENNQIQLRGRQLAATASLINALGGGWQGIKIDP
ncbi:MAG: efflux transporter outer membrane subunit [Burkholderiales bacterium]|jgi:NodT family efflux transporter outer membrane factor (OMF) lipoprotein|nr:efflux transporter outer membrane subunit [Burkholderiales bacterium]